MAREGCADDARQLLAADCRVRAVEPPLEAWEAHRVSGPALDYERRDQDLPGRGQIRRVEAPQVIAAQLAALLDQTQPGAGGARHDCQRDQRVLQAAPDQEVVEWFRGHVAVL